MSLRGDEVGLFWQEVVKVKLEKKTPVVRSREPAVLKPYVARPSIPYQLMLDEDIVRHAGDDLIFDTESFTNFFMVAFKHVQSGKIISLIHPFDIDMLEWIMRNYTVIGFNSLRYDLPLLWMAHAGAPTEMLKAASTDIISGMRLHDACNKYGIVIPNTKHIDLIEVVPLIGSLKLYGARLHARRIQDVPWANQPELEDWQIPITIDYCINDLDLTELIFQNLTEQLELRLTLSRQYNQDLMSKSDAQIAEAVIRSELEKITGRRPAKRKVDPNTVYHFRAPDNLTFKTDYMQNILRMVEQADFMTDASGYLKCPPEIKEVRVQIGNGIYRMGIGGLHSSEKCTAIHADEDHIIVDRFWYDLL